MGETYTVIQGDHLARIAAQFGFADYRIVWNDPANRTLKESRKNPNVLLPGDQIAIPDRGRKEEAAATGGMHAFQVDVTRLMLRITLEDARFKPVAGARCELTVDGETFTLVTDENGRLEQAIHPKAQTAALIIRDGVTALNDQFIPVRIGHLDPIDEVSGQKGRLNNLGYFAGPLDQDDEALFRSAVEEFQCDQLGPLAVDGKCGPKTQARLKEMHGS